MVQTTDTGILNSLDIIFAGILVGGINPNDTKIKAVKKEVFKGCMGRFKSNFQEQIFFNNYALYHSVIMALKVSVFGVDQLKSIIENNFDMISDSPYIDLSAYKMNTSGGALSREEKIVAYTEDIIEDFIRLSNMEVSEEEFNSACNVYVEFFKDKFYYDTIMNMALIMSNDGIDIKLTRKRSKHYQGRVDAQFYYMERQKVLDSLEEENGIKHTVLNSDTLRAEYEKDKQVDDDAVIDYGIDEIDSVKGWMRRGNIVEFMGPPKGGKTTITSFEVARALMKGLNVTVWPLEGTQDEWVSLIIATLIRMDANNSMSIDKKDILNRSFKSEEEKVAVMAMRQRLYCDPEFGRLSFISGTAYVEDFRDILKVHYETQNPYDIIVIDSPINFMSRRGLTKVDRLSQGYMLLKDFVANKMKVPPLCLVTAQLKQEVVDSIRRNPSETIDVTAGGETAESIRTPDEVIGLFSTKNERALGQMKICSVASRHNGDFDDCYIGCELGCGYFFSDPSLNQ